MLVSRQGNVQGYKRVDGPSDEEVADKKKKQREVGVIIFKTLLV